MTYDTAGVVNQGFPQGFTHFRPDRFWVIFLKKAANSLLFLPFRDY
jgi:hypothetical protein